MGLQLPRRAVRVVGALAVGSTVVALAGCSAEDRDQIGRLAMPEPGTEQAPHIYDLWRYSWLAAIIVGVIVWGLIFWAVIRYRRRSDDEIPVQTRYNLPLEIFYTIAPIMMVIVFFVWTVRVQDVALAEVDNPDVTIEVVGQQWSWTFNYGVGEPTGEATPVKTGVDEGGTTLYDYRYDDYAYFAGTASDIPTLYLPVDRTVQFNLHSPDVIHNFWVVGFLMKMDVVPGRINHFQVTPNRIGTFEGKCAELCGTFHSRMLFNVEVVSQADYDAYVQSLEDAGQVSTNGPLLGGDQARTQAGLGDHAEGAHSDEGAEGTGEEGTQ